MNAEAAYIREAIAGEDYEKALAQWNTYTHQIEQAIEAGILSPDQMGELRELFEWSRTVLLCAREHLRDRCRSLDAVGAYRTRQASRPPSLGISL